MKPLPPPNEQPIDGMPKAYHFLLLWINVQRGEPLVMARSTWQLLPLVHTQFAAPFPVARQAATMAAWSFGQPSHYGKSAQESDE